MVPAYASDAARPSPTVQWRCDRYYARADEDARRSGVGSMIRRSTLLGTALLMACVSVAAPVSAQGAPRAVLEVVEVDVLATAPGETSYFHPRWRNVGDATAMIQSWTITGPDAHLYRLESDPPVHGLPVGDTERVRMRFTPHAARRSQASLEIGYDIDVADGVETSDVLVVPIDGLATDAPTGLVQVPDLPLFGPVVQDEWVEGSFLLRNDSSDTLAYEIDLTSNDIQTVGIPCDKRGPLAPGGTCTVRLKVRHKREGRTHDYFYVRTPKPYRDLHVRFATDVVPNPAYPDTKRPRSLVFDPFRVVKVSFSPKTTLTLRMSYSAVDERMMGGYGVKAKVGGGVERIVLDQQPPFPDPPRPIDHIDMPIKVGQLVEASFRAWDAAGNKTGWVRSDWDSVFSLVDTTRTTAQVSSGWRVVPRPRKSYRGSVLRTTKAGASITQRLRGREFSLIGRRSPASGKLQVWVDGRLIRTVNLRSATATGPRVLTTFHTDVNKSHTVKLVVVKSGPRSEVTVDAWAVGG